MDRKNEILKFITKEERGIEIAPYFTPLVPKSQGYNALVLDVFDERELIRRAICDPNIPKSSVGNIEIVDMVGSAVEIESLAKEKGVSQHSLSYITSSHNFEHLPDPVRFLQGCSAIIKDGGILSMAIPDKRGCFDFFRQPSELADVLDAYLNGFQQPTDTMIFSMNASPAHVIGPEGGMLGSFLSSTDKGLIIPQLAIRDHFQAWKNRINARKSGDVQCYVDAHCWVFTPVSFRLILLQLAELDLIRFEIIEIIEPGGNEFIVHLRNRVEGSWEGSRGAEIVSLLRQSVVGVCESGRREVVERSAVNRVDYLGLAAALREKDGRIQELKRVSDSQSREIESMGAVIARKDDEIQSYNSSFSWQLTAPLRVLGVIARKILGK
jgi:hypothetical protein